MSQLPDPRAALEALVQTWLVLAAEHADAAETYPDAAIEGWIQLGHSEGFKTCATQLAAALASSDPPAVRQSLEKKEI